MNLKKLILFLVLSFIFALHSPNVHAASDYDELVNPSATAKIGGGGTCSVDDITHSWLSMVHDDYISYSGGSTSKASVLSALDTAVSNGSGISLVQQTSYDTNILYYVSVIITPSANSASFQTDSSYLGDHQYLMVPNSIKVDIYKDGYDSCITKLGFSASSIDRVLAQHFDLSQCYGSFCDERQPVFIANPVTYPTGYEGTTLPNPEDDQDSDGLTQAQESIQGTSDTNADTDGDGLNDYVESGQFVDRDDVFCGTSECAYPDPTKKDIYVEIDWMYDSSNSRLLKPTSTQVGILTDMYADHGINFHADTGQYGGGNLLPSYVQTLHVTATPSVTDYADFKDSNYDSTRENIWKYMIYGYEYYDSPGSSGVAEVSGDDIFVSGGLVEDDNSTVNQDRAVAGTMAHEIGHTLCLSSTQSYEEQPAACVYSAIDNNSNKPTNYKSVMNYLYQLTDDGDMGVVDYSDGTNGTGDHDDWSAIDVGMGDFSGTKTALGAEKSAIAANKIMDSDFTVQEAPISQGTNSQATKNDTAIKSQAQSLNNHPVNESVKKDQATDRGTDNSNDLLIGVGIIATLVVVSGAVWYVKTQR